MQFNVCVKVGTSTTSYNNGIGKQHKFTAPFHSKVYIAAYAANHMLRKSVAFVASDSNIITLVQLYGQFIKLHLNEDIGFHIFFRKPTELLRSHEM